MQTALTSTALTSAPVAPKCHYCPRPARAGFKACDQCAQRQRQKVKANRRAGLCACGRTPADGKTSCEPCLASINASIKRLRQRRLAEGLCVQCGKQSELGQARCLTCSSTRRKRLPRPVADGLRELRKEREREETERLKAERDLRLSKLREFIDSRADLIEKPRTVEILKARLLEGQTLEAVGKTLGVREQGRNYRFIGLEPKTQILQSDVTKDFYQWWTKA